MTPLVKDRMTTAFTVIRADMSPASASAQLSPGMYGVLVGKSGEPVALVLAEDLAQTTFQNAPTFFDSETFLPPTGIVGSEIAMNFLANSDVIGLFKLKSRGAVVIDDSEHVAGVLPAETVHAFLGGGEYKSAINTMGGDSAKGGQLGGAALAGKFQTPLARLKCLVCGYINSLTELDDENPPLCANPTHPPHTLKYLPE